MKNQICIEIISIIVKIYITITNYYVLQYKIKNMSPVYHGHIKRL